MKEKRKWEKTTGRRGVIVACVVAAIALVLVILWLLRGSAALKPVEPTLVPSNVPLTTGDFAPVLTPTTQAEPNQGVFIVQALDAAWHLTWEGDGPPTPTVQEGDVSCWRIEAMDTEAGEAWRCQQGELIEWRWGWNDDE